jgi:hypothetical protein
MRRLSPSSAVDDLKPRWVRASEIDLQEIRAGLDAERRLGRRQAIIDAANTPFVQQPTPDQEFAALLGELRRRGQYDIVGRLERIVPRPIPSKRGQPTAPVQRKYHRLAIEVQAEIARGRRKKAAYSIVAAINKVSEATVRRAYAAYYWHALIAVEPPAVSP